MDLGKPFERITMVDAVKKYAGVDFDEIKTIEQARAVAKEHHVEFEDRHQKGEDVYKRQLRSSLRKNQLRSKKKRLINKLT